MIFVLYIIPYVAVLGLTELVALGLSKFSLLVKPFSQTCWEVINDQLYILPVSYLQCLYVPCLVCHSRFSFVIIVTHSWYNFLFILKQLKLGNDGKSQPRFTGYTVNVLKVRRCDAWFNNRLHRLYLLGSSAVSFSVYEIFLISMHEYLELSCRSCALFSTLIIRFCSSNCSFVGFPVPTWYLCIDYDILILLWYLCINYYHTKIC